MLLEVMSVSMVRELGGVSDAHLLGGANGMLCV